MLRMMRGGGTVASFLPQTCRRLCTRPMTAQETPFLSGPGVLDTVHVLPVAVQDKLTSKITDLRATTGAEVAIVVLADAAYRDDPISKYAGFTRALFDEWGIGRAGVNDVRQCPQ